MENYVLINEHSINSGALAISKKVFEKITIEATNRVLGNLGSAKKSKADIYDPIKIIFNKNGQVSIKVSISISKSANLSEIPLEIQKEIAHDLAAYVESVPFEISVIVDEIK